MSKDKVAKEFPEFVDEVQGLTIEALRNRIVNMQQALDESEAHKEANDTLKEARANLTELSGPYRDVKRAIQLKTRYIIELLREKGNS